MFYEQTLLNSPFYDLHYILTSDLVNVNYAKPSREEAQTNMIKSRLYFLKLLKYGRLALQATHDFPLMPAQI